MDPKVPEPLELEVMGGASVEVEVLGENSVCDKAKEGIEYEVSTERLERTEWADDRMGIWRRGSWGGEEN